VVGSADWSCNIDSQGWPEEISVSTRLWCAVLIGAATVMGTQNRVQ